MFELDFEANLPIVRACVQLPASASSSRRRPRSTACATTPSSIRRIPNLVLGPINKPRWIYACAKQLMDRVIHAYGMQEGLDYTLFRPFNWIGAGLDSINTAKEGSSRVITQFLGHIVRGEPIKLVDGGTQKRAFTYIDDGIDALMKIIDNNGRHRDGQDLQHRQSARTTTRCASSRTMMLELALHLSGISRHGAAGRAVETTTAKSYYGAATRTCRTASPRSTTRAPSSTGSRVTMEDALTRIFDAYRGQVAEARQLVD